MNKKDFMASIDRVINDWNSTSFSFSQKDYVPGLDDPNLTYGNGQEKKGVEINTCVLFVDIRNSVQLTKDKQDRTMGRLYSVFTQCMLLAAQEEGGFVRNIIGDRVMIVFPPNQCYTKAVKCAITINHIATHINRKIDNLDFKCGIGVDYGRMRVMKVGVVKKGAENDDNKGLVWIGCPANFASRLTDCANKEFNDVVYRIDAYFYHHNYFGVNPFLDTRASGYYRETKDFTAEELAESLSVQQRGVNTIVSNKFTSPISIQPISNKFTYSPILMSEAVFNGYKKENPNAKDIINGWWTEQVRKIRDIDFKIFGANLTWNLS